MTRPVPGHGTANRYAYGCRCKPCTQAATRADAERKLDRLAGRPRQVPAGPAAAHARALMGRGLSLAQIARESDVQTATIRRIVLGQREVLAATAKSILGVPLNVRVSTGDVPAIGAVRRVRALYALGHLNWVIAEESGVSRDGVCALAAGQWSTLKVAADDGIRAAYDQLSMRRGTSWKTELLAAKNGWASPLAWDDDTIDDPNAVPQTDAPEPVVTEGGNVADRWLHGESVILDRKARKEVLQHLFEWTNDTPEEIAARLEMNVNTVWQTWTRIKKQARAEGRREPWRRVYMPRERDLKQTEMGEAA